MCNEKLRVCRETHSFTAGANGVTTAFRFTGVPKPKTAHRIMKTKIRFQNHLPLWTCILLAFVNLPARLHAGGKVAVWGDNTFSQSFLPNGLDNVKAIAAGSRHSLALKTDGTVVAWGQTNNGGANIVPVGLAGVKAIAAGGNWNLALKTDGTVTGWGAYNADLRVGGLSNVTAIAGGWYHWLALKADGSLATWSAGGNTYTPTNLPAGLSNVIALAAGLEFSLALKSDGTVTAWGWNEYGQTNVPPGLSNIVAIATSAASSHSLALKADGTVVAWGGNWEGQATVPPNLTNVIAVAAGHSHSLALKADGSVVAWGNATGSYPNRGQSIVPPGLANVKAIAAGESHSLALVFDGPPEILTQPGDTEVSHQSNVVLTVTANGAAPLGYRWYFNGNPLTDSGRISGAATAGLSITNAQFADAGVYSVVVSNAFGLVASTGATLTVSSPPFITQQPADRTVRAGSDVTFAAAANGTSPLRYQWHFNGNPILGATSTTLALTNVQSGQSGYYHMRVTNLYGETSTIRALLTVTDTPPYFLRLPSNQVAVLGGSASFIAAARGSEPLKYQWRFNGVDIPSATNATLQLTQLRYDQTGYYSVEASNAFGATNSPKVLLNVSQVMLVGAAFAGNTNLPVGLTNVIAVAAGSSHAMALRADGTVRTWLANPGYILVSATAVTNIPASVTNVIAIAAGYDHCLALRSNGTVVAWGASGPHTIVPVGLSNVVTMAAGSSRSFAVKSDGTVVGWGTSAIVPVGLSNVVAVAAWQSQNLALKRDGSVFVWGTGSLTNLPAGTTNIIALVASASHNLFLKQNGTVLNSSVAGGGSGLPANLSNVVAIAAGPSVSLALRHDGALFVAGLEKNAFPLTNNIIAIAAGGLQGTFGIAVIGTGAPVVTLQPISQIVQRTNTVQLHARAAGLPPLRYQWLQDDAPLAGATNASLMLSNILGPQTGNYRMIVSNALGTATTWAATITIPFNTNLPAALNSTNLQWTTPADRNVPWFAQNRETHDGDAAAQSGATTNNGTSTLQVYLPNPGTLSFWWKVSSEEDFDYLRVYLGQSTTPLFSISGATDWEQKTITLTNAGNVLRWVYSKDGSVSAGRDAGFLDEVKYTVPSPIVSISPSNQTVTAGANASFFATTLSYEKPVYYQWRLNGTNIVGATNQTLALLNVGRANQGSYSVLATNSGGSTLASNATLTVIVPQLLSSLRCNNGCVELLSRDADGCVMSATLLPKFEAQVSSNLVDWVSLPNALTLTNGSLLVRDPEPPRWPRRFYRVVEH